MKRFASFSFILAAVVLTALTASPSFAAASFCWSDSYGRGVGTVPRSCPQSQEMVGLFCYDACPKSDFYGGPGMKRAGIDCHSICPTGMDDQGLFCRASETGRGSGYPWKVGDALNLSGALSRCEAVKRATVNAKNGERSSIPNVKRATPILVAVFAVRPFPTASDWG